MPPPLQYPRYLDADRLCSGVMQAYAFRAALAEVRTLQHTAAAPHGLLHVHLRLAH